jgi:transcription elongation factor GreA
MVQRVPITAAGLKKLQEELKRFKEVERPKNVRDIEEARGHGDLSENAEYHAAKERQAFISGSMRDLEDKIGRAEVIDPTRLSGTKIMFGATVTLLEVEKEEEVRYQIVGEDEADLSRGLISVTSPIGRALIGKEPGDEVQVRAPAGKRIYEVVDVEFI